MTKVEEVARAMKARALAEQEQDSILLEEAGDWLDDSDWIALARAAVEAMRVPSAGMVEAGYQQIDWWRGSHETGDWTPMPAGSLSPQVDVNDAWSAMIDAALQEGV